MEGVKREFYMESIMNLKSFFKMPLQLTSDWIHVYPRGIRDALLYTKTKYQNPLIFITENGNFLLNFSIMVALKLWH